MSRPSTAAQWSLLLVAGVLGMVLATPPGPVVPVAAFATPAAASETRTPRPADRPWVGFAIPRTRSAASGWIGARRIHGEVVVYRTDPGRRTSRRGFTRAFVETRTTRSFRASGGGRVGPARTSCAALLLGRYGVPGRAQPQDERRLQAAAVDVAVQHLLHGRGFRHDGPAQRRRTDQRADGPLVRAYAEKLVTDECPLAGPYRVTLVPAAVSAEVGDLVVHTATVRSRTGTPVPRVLLRVTPGDGSTPFDLRTGGDGVATFEVRAARSGPLTTTTVTRGLAPSSVRVRLPRARGASRVVVAGIELGDAHDRSASVAVRGQPVVRLLRTGPVARSAPFRLGFRLGAAYPGRRTAAVQVFGPLTAGTTTCRPDRLSRQRRVPVSEDGDYRTDTLSLTRRGTYLWRVAVPGDTYNAPVSVCGGEFRVQ